MKNLFYTSLFLALFSCSNLDDERYEQQYVVEAYLQADSTFPYIYLTKTLPIDEFYSFDNAAISGASIRVYELNQFREVVDSIEYREAFNYNGIYASISDKTVKPLTRYQLKVVIPQDNNYLLTAETFVPGAFSTISANSDTVIYQAEEQLSIDYTKSFYPGRQSYYILTVVAQDTTGELTPFYARATENGNPTRTQLAKNSSGILNEANFEENPDQSVAIQLPWLAVAFYGEHEIWAHTIDDALYNFLRSKETQFGGSTVSPGEIYDVLDNVDGGTGVFGSYYKTINNVYIKKLEIPGF